MLISRHACNLSPRPLMARCLAGVAATPGNPVSLCISAASTSGRSSYSLHSTTSSHRWHGVHTSRRRKGHTLHKSSSSSTTSGSSNAQPQEAHPFMYTPMDGNGTDAKVFHPPLVDISGLLQGAEPCPELIQQVRTECINTGFLALSGHGISTQLMAEVMASATRFFDLPLSAKRRCIVGDMRLGRGWEMSPEHQSYMKQQLALSGVEPSALEGILSERFCCGPPWLSDRTADEYYTCELGQTFFAPDVWPEAVRLADACEMKSIMQEYYTSAAVVAAAVLRLFAAALQLPPSFFDDKIDRHCSNLQVAHYPSQPIPPGPDDLRKKAHVDSGTLTLLASQDWEEGGSWVPGDGGLQLLDVHGHWHEVAVPPGSLLLNLGSLMTRWTNGLWKSTLHRVTNPSNSAAAQRRRLSIAFFHKVNYDALVEVLPTCCSTNGDSGLAAPRFAPALAADLTRAGILRRYAHLPPAEASAAELAATRAAA